MKIRNGFVSNSSSSSFVIAVPSGMEMTPENLHREIFGSDADLQFGPEWDFGISVSSKQIIDEMLRQINANDNREFGGYNGRAGKIPDDKLNLVIEPDFDFNIFKKFEKVDPKTGKIAMDWDAYKSFESVETNKAVELVRNNFPNCDFYVVEFEDHDPFGSEVEHGEALRDRSNIIRYNHH